MKQRGNGEKMTFFLGLIPVIAIDRNWFNSLAFGFNTNERNEISMLWVWRKRIEFVPL